MKSRVGVIGGYCLCLLVGLAGRLMIGGESDPVVPATVTPSPTRAESTAPPEASQKPTWDQPQASSFPTQKPPVEATQPESHSEPQPEPLSDVEATVSEMRALFDQFEDANGFAKRWGPVPLIPLAALKTEGPFLLKGETVSEQFQSAHERIGRTNHDRPSSLAASAFQTVAYNTGQNVRVVVGKDRGEWAGTRSLARILCAAAGKDPRELSAADQDLLVVLAEEWKVEAEQLRHRLWSTMSESAPPSRDFAAFFAGRVGGVWKIIVVPPGYDEELDLLLEELETLRQDTRRELDRILAGTR